MKRSKMRAGLIFGLATVLLVACGSTSRRPASPAAPAAPPLRVVMPSDSPPYAFYKGEGLAGLEVDFARELATALGRRLEIVPAEWVDVLPTLLAGRADMAMSGLTITPARQVRIAFSDPYLRSGLLTLMRREDTGRYMTTRAVLENTNAIGVVAETTGERFVREHVRTPSVIVYPTPLAAVTELRQRRVDVVVHDVPVAIWYAASDEANLAALLKPLNEEQLGWGMRLGDEALQSAVNGVLARWRTDGTRDRIVTRWIPYWQRLEQPAPVR
jgi:polar amino acid transport system substrate-binding protein